MTLEKIRVLITNFHSSKNAGDLALLEGLLNDLRDLISDAQVTVLANWPDEPYFTNRPDCLVIPSPWSLVHEGQNDPPVLRILRLLWGCLALVIYLLGANQSVLRHIWPGWFTLFDAYRSANLVIGVAGNPLYSMGRMGWPFPAIAMSIWLAHVFKRPFYTMPQSIGPLKRGWERICLSYIYGRAQAVFLREPISIRLAHDIGINRDIIHFAPDPAFAYPAANPSSAANLLSGYGYEPGKLSLGVTLIAPMGHALDARSIEQYYQSVVVFFKQFLEQLPDAKIYFFNQVTGPTTLEDDRKAVERVLAEMPEYRGRVIWIQEQLTPDRLKACYGLMHMMIASRLHSGIFALAMEVPTIFVGYLSKTRGLLEALSLPDWGIELNQVTPNRFAEFCWRAWNLRADSKEQLAQIIPGVIDQARLPILWIANDFIQNQLKKSINHNQD